MHQHKVQIIVRERDVNFKIRVEIMDKLKILIPVIIVIVGAGSFGLGYMFFGGSQEPQNIKVKQINETLETGTSIPYSSEYISFSDAMSIAQQNAASGVSVSDPVLIKARNGRAVYVSSYYYNQYIVK